MGLFSSTILKIKALITFKDGKTDVATMTSSYWVFAPERQTIINEFISQVERSTGKAVSHINLLKVW